MAREEPSPCEVMAIAQEEALEVGGEVARVVSMEVVSQQVWTTQGNLAGKILLLFPLDCQFLGRDVFNFSSW
jgi:hypothetical protein